MKLFREGSLLRRTIVHALAFLLASSAFVGILAWGLTALAKSVLPKHADAAASASARGASAPPPSSIRPGGVAARPPTTTPVPPAPRPPAAAKRGLTSPPAGPRPPTAMQNPTDE